MGCGEAGGKVTPIQPSDITTVNIEGVNPTAFGELSVAEITPNIQIQFAYNVNPAQVLTRANQSGGTTVASGLASVSSGAAANSSCELISRSASKYRTGQGGVWRLAGYFTAGVASSEQLIGIGNAEDGFFFGYNGADFGVLHRRAGASEIRTLTVDTKSSNAENITITLNGVAKTDVAVTNGADATVTANEIAAADYSDVGRGWVANAVGDTVIFISWGSGSKSGAYTLSGATSAVGTYAQVRAGVQAEDLWIAQAAWNVDTMDGTGASGVTLDPTKGNVYQVQFQWLGFGMIKFYVEDGSAGTFVNVHNVQYANENTVLSIINPTLPVYVGATNFSNTSEVIVKTGSMMAGTQGIKQQVGINFGASVLTSPGTAAEVPILSLRNKEVFQSVLNRVELKIMFISASVEHTKPVSINFWASPALVGAAWSDVSTNASVTQIDTAATSFSGGSKLFSLSLGSKGTEVVELTNPLTGILRPGETITATAVPESLTSHSAAVSFNWVEDF